MAYSVNLYTTDSDSKKVNKHLRSSLSKTCEIRSNEDIEKPTIMLSLPSGGNYNYAQIMGAPYNGRYYFIEPYIASANGNVVLTLHEDYLMSLIGARKVATGKGIVTKYIGGDKFVDNGSFRSETRQEIEQVDFPEGFNKLGEYILITAGGY